MGLLDRAAGGWRRRRVQAAEAAAFPDAGLGDLGMSRADLVAAARMDADRIGRMTAMAALHGVAPGVLAADPRIGNDVARTCAHCPDDAACRAAFARPGGPDPAATAFCPNLGTFRALAGAQG